MDENEITCRLLERRPIGYSRAAQYRAARMRVRNLETIVRMEATIVGLAQENEMLRRHLASDEQPKHFLKMSARAAGAG
jgi:hypothetical protein